MAKRQSNRLTEQQKEGQGPITIYHNDAQIHDQEVGNTSQATLCTLQLEYPMLQFRHRESLTKKEINLALQKIDNYLGQTLFVENASIRPDGGLIEVMDDHNNWRVVLVTEAKHQGKDIENIKAGKYVGKKTDQDIMAAGNAIERAYKNVNEIANYMLSERYFPYILFLEGSNFLTQDVIVERPDGRKVKLEYSDGTLNRLDRLTAANYGMPINTNLCKNRFVQCNDTIIMLQAPSIYTQGGGGHWEDSDMINIMLDVAHTSLKMLACDLFDQFLKNS